MTKWYIFLTLTMVAELSIGLSAMNVPEETKDYIKLIAQDGTFRPWVMNALKKNKEKAVEMQRKFNARVMQHKNFLDTSSFEEACMHSSRQQTTQEREEVAQEMITNSLTRRMEDLGFSVDELLTRAEMIKIQSKINVCHTILAVLDEK